MTNPTPHGQVPEALIDLIDAYAETRHRCGGIYNARTEAARNAVIEALSGVQALSAAPEAIAKLRHLYQNMVNGAVRDTASAKRIAEGLLAPAIEALERATPPAEQQAQPGAVYAGLPERRRVFLCTKCGGRECESGSIHQTHPPCKCGYLGFAEDLDFNADEMRAFADRTHALRMEQAAPKGDGFYEAINEMDRLYQAAPKAAPVVWLSSKQLRGVTALHGQYLPFRCQPEGRFDTPVYLVEAAPKAAPGEKEETKAERFRRLLDYDTRTGVFTWKSARGGLPANSEAGYVHTDKYGNKYRCIKIDGKIYQVQRVVFMHCFGLDLGKFEVDYIDGDTFNNAISNLRIVTHKQNSENRRLGANNKSGYMGVSWSKKDQTWIASIKHHGKSIFLGHFANAESAHEAYEEKRAELFTHDEGRHLPQPAPAQLSEPMLLLRQILEASQDGDSDTHLSAHFVSCIETITKQGGEA